MSISQRPRSIDGGSSHDRFIASAPDGVPKTPGILRGRKRQITVTFDPELLQGIDALAGRLRLSRAGLINMACAQLVERGGAAPAGAAGSDLQGS